MTTELEEQYAIFNSFVYLHLLGHQSKKPALKELCRHSDAVSSFWWQLALELDFQQQTITRIDAEKHSIKEKCYDMFSTWLERSPDACWCHIVNALKMCEKLQLAEDIEKSFLGVVRNTWTVMKLLCNYMWAI